MKGPNRMALLYQIFGEDKIKLYCSSLLYDDVEVEQMKIEKTFD